MDNDHIDAAAPRKRRGKASGGHFFNICVSAWRDVWAKPDLTLRDQLNRMVTYLVMARGTGPDHAQTSWSAHAVEKYGGIGKRVAAQAISSLAADGLLEPIEGSPPNRPRYRLLFDPDAERILLPNALVSGLGSERPMLRRLRETAMPELLVLLVHLYGQVQLDQTHSIAPSIMFGRPTPERVEPHGAGANIVWFLPFERDAKGNKASIEALFPEIVEVRAGLTGPDLRLAIDTLEQMGAIRYVPWLCDGNDLDAQPLVQLPHDLFVAQGSKFPPSDDKLRQLAKAAEGAVRNLTHLGDYAQTFKLFAVPLPRHMPAPAVRWLVRLTVEVDSAGARRSYGERMSTIERWIAALQQLASLPDEEKFRTPLPL